ncbi:YcfA-like protein [compost metagenome]
MMVMRMTLSFFAYVEDGTILLMMESNGQGGLAKGIMEKYGIKEGSEIAEEVLQKNGSLKLDLQFFAKSKFPTGSISGKDVVKFLKKDGFDVVSQSGSHVKLKGPEGEVVIVPVHGNKDLPIGTLKSIQKQAGY